MTARSLAWPLALFALAVGAPPAAARAHVSSGRLAADAAPNPWRLTFRENGRAILAESGGRGSGALGALGFRTAAGWSRATRVLSSRREGSALSLQLATTDARRRLAVRIAPDGEGVIRLAAAVDGPGLLPVTHTGIAFEARGGERYLGFGERSNAVDQRGGDVESYVSDGPYQRIERPVIRTSSRPGACATATTRPTSPCRGCSPPPGTASWSRTPRPACSAWSDRSTWGVEAQAPRLELRVFAGPRPADALRRLTRHTGRQPAAAARWFHGPWFQPTGDEAEQIEMVRRLRRGDVPASAVNTFLHYLPCGDQEGIRDRQRTRTAALKREGVAVTTYFNPMVCSTYRQAFGPASAAGALTKNALGAPYLYRYSASTDDLFLVGQYDFSSSQGNRLFQSRLAEATQDGYDGWMEDFGEYTPPDSRSANGMTGAQMHNLYPVLYHRSSYEFARRQPRPTAGYVRSGFTGVHPYAQLVWGGDPTTSFGFDGLESAVRQGLTMGLSGISRWGSDIGGFFALGNNKLTPELLKRWIEVGAVSGIMRTEANGVALPSRDRPQIDDPDVLPVWRRWAKLRTQLYPYLAAADAQYRRTGLPLMRHLSLTNPDRPRRALARRPVHVRPRPAGGAGAGRRPAHAVGLPAPRAVGGPLAHAVLRQPPRRPAAGRARGR